MKSLSEVTDADLGQWIAGASVYNPIEFNVRIVELARTYGFELNDTAWEESLPILNGDLGEVPFDLLEDLGYTSDEALAYLNSQLPDWYYFDFLDGLCLLKDEETA